MTFDLPKIYPITDAGLSGISHAEQVRRLVGGGARLIQLREKDRGAAHWIDDARDALAAAKNGGAKLIINDRVDVAMMIGADGVHLGQDDLPPAEARKLLGPDKIIGFSTHSLEQALAALELPVDYIGVGPIFATNTKPAHDPVVGIELLSTIRNTGGSAKIVAIGGINADTLLAVLNAGADSAAMVGAVIGEADLIGERMKAMIRLASVIR
ncbi:MAG: thiamine phosphate synthase [Pyrinomonadaceae bacterium]|nr:thiamine phosphate synthase [Pyrinomonadaceae bacterium]